MSETAVLCIGNVIKSLTSIGGVFVGKLFVCLIILLVGKVILPFILPPVVKTLLLSSVCKLVILL